MLVLSMGLAPTPCVHAQATAAAPDPEAASEQPAAPLPSYSARARVKAPAQEPFALRAPEAQALRLGLGPAFSTVESMPGVIPVFSGVPYLIVRGASPSGSLTYYDGIQVPALFHVALGPSVIAPELTGTTLFMPSVAGSNYAAHLGGVLERTGPDARTLATPMRHIELSLLDASGLLNLPTQSGALTLAWRYGTPGLMIRALGLDATLGYYDYQLRYLTTLSTRTQLSVVMLGANDHLGERTVPADDIDLNFHRVRASLTTRYRQVELGTSLLLSSDVSTLGQQLHGSALRATESAYLQWQGDALHLRAGADVSSALVKLTSAANQIGTMPEQPFGTPSVRRREIVLDPEDFLNGQPFSLVPNRNMLGAYAELRWHPLPPVHLTLGARADAFIAGSEIEAAVSPMLRARYAVTDYLDLRGALALTHKPRTSPLPLPGLNDISLDRGIEGAFQSELGTSLRLDDSTTLEANLFYSRYLDTVYMELILDCQGNTNPSATPGVRELIGAPESICRNDGLPTANGDSYGLELFAKRDLTKKLAGFLSYTHSYAHATSRDGTGFVPQSDVRHLANLVLLYQLGGGWSAGARAHFRTGKMAVNTILDLNRGEVARLYYRLPPFFRLDLHLTYGFQAAFGRLTATLGLQNSTFSREATHRNCMAQAGAVVCEVDYQPYIVLPNVALRADF